LCRCQRALRAPHRVDCQRNGALQKRGRGGDPAASLSPVSRQLELEGNLLVWCERRMSAMPGAAIRVALGIGGLCQRPMRVSTPVGGRGTVDRRPEQWVAERDSRTEQRSGRPLRQEQLLRSEDQAGQRLAKGALDRRSVGRAEEQQALRLLG